MAPSIKDFFKKIDPSSASSSSMTSPKKRPVAVDGSDGDFQPEQKLKRSTKTLVKSKSKTMTAAPIDLTEDQPASPKKASPQKPPAKPVSPGARTKPASPKKSPVKGATPAVTPVKRPGAKSKIIFAGENDEVYEEAVPIKAEAPASPAGTASPSTAKKFK